MSNKSDNKPTIKTIAKIAGVSHSTVSRALLNDRRITPATTEKIKKIANDIGYTPNKMARALVTKTIPLNIGMVVPAMGSNTAYNMDYEYISAEAARRGLSILLGSCNRDIELEKQLCRIMCENHVSALFISPISGNISHIKEICQGKVPVIFIGGKTGTEEEYYITMDYAHGLHVAVDHLYSHGHRDIALAVYSPDNKTIQQKIDGYQAAMRSYDLTPAIYWEGNNTDTFSAGKLLIKRLLSEKKMPTAICCASDLMAIGVIDELRANGLNVPGDISVIGHDDLFLSGIASFSITTLAICETDLAKNALDLALSIINSTVGVNGYTMTASLIERSTTAQAKT